MSIFASPTDAEQRPAKPVRRRRPGHERRLEILAVATRVFHRKGYEAASLQGIADALGIRKASLFYYFPSKEDLLYEVLTVIISRGIANSKEIMAIPGDPLSVLWRLIVGHIRQLCEYLEETAVFLHERKSLPPERRRSILAEDYAYQDLFVQAISDGKDAGQIRADVDPKLAALSILGSANWTYTWYRRNGGLTPDVIGEQFATMSVNGLATPQAMDAWTRPA